MQMARKALLNTLKLVIPYLVLGLLWIFFSDRIVDSTDSSYQSFQTFKGFLFVALTAIFIFLVMYFLLLDVFRSQDTYRQLFQAMPVITWVSDAATREIVSVNREALDTYGYTAEEFKGMDYLNLFHEEDQADYLKAIPILNNRYDKVWRHRRKDGSIMYMQGRSILITPSKKPMLLSMVRDITSEYLDQQEKERLYQQVLQKNKNLGQFAYVVSHNLRSPVARIKGLLDAIREEAMADALHKQLLAYLKEASEELDEMIIDLSKVVHTEDDASLKEWVDVDEMMGQLLAQLRHEYAELDLQITSRGLENIGQLYTVKSFLYSILYNLLQNAVKYRKEEATVHVQLQALSQEGGIRIKIKDFGKGINLDRNGQKLFELYTRLDTSVEGKGMGLYMVKTQVEALGGFIEVQSEEGDWTEFEVFLPRESRRK